MSARWEQMHSGEREKFRHGMAGRCGPSGGEAEQSGAPGSV